MFEQKCWNLFKVSFTHENLLKVSVVYELNIWSRDLHTDFILKECLFGTVKAT